jgi:hypothetical protein
MSIPESILYPKTRGTCFLKGTPRVFGGGGGGGGSEIWKFGNLKHSTLYQIIGLW